MELGAPAAKSRLAPKGKPFAAVHSPEVGTVVASTRNPLHCVLLKHFCKEPSVQGLALRVVSALSVHRHRVHQVQVLLKRSVHEGDSVLFELVVGQLLRMVFKPFDLAASDAVVSDLTQALVVSCPEEPDPAHWCACSIVSLDGKLEIEAVLDWLAKVQETIASISVQRAEAESLKHVLLRVRSFVVMVARYEAPGNIERVNPCEEVGKVFVEEIWTLKVVHLA